MTRDEFVSKYKVGDKVVSSRHSNLDFVEILFLGEKSFFGKNHLGFEGAYRFHYYKWLPYKELNILKENK